MLGSVSIHFSTVHSRVLGPMNILYSVFIYSLAQTFTKSTFKCEALGPAFCEFPGK